MLSMSGLPNQIALECSQITVVLTDSPMLGVAKVNGNNQVH